MSKKLFPPFGVIISASFVSFLVLMGLTALLPQRLSRISEITYLLFLFIWIAFALRHRLTSSQMLKTGLVLFFVSSVLNILRLSTIAELIFRLNFIIWSTGLIKALVDQLKSRAS